MGGKWETRGVVGGGGNRSQRADRLINIHVQGALTPNFPCFIFTNQLSEEPSHRRSPIDNDVLVRIPERI